MTITGQRTQLNQGLMLQGIKNPYSKSPSQNVPGRSSLFAYSVDPDSGFVQYPGL